MNRLIKKNWIKSFAILLISILFTQCMHDEFQFDKLNTDIELEGGFFSPLAYGSLTISDLMKDIDSSANLSTYPDGLLYFSYSDSLFSYLSEDILTVPDQDFFQYFIDTDFAISIPGWSFVELDRSEYFPFLFSNKEELDSIYLDKGDIVFNINSSFQHTGIIVITCPSIRLNGVPFSDTVQIDVSSGTYTSNNTFPLDGYVITLKDSVGTDTTFLPVDFHVELYEEPGNPVNAGDQIEIVATIINLDFEAVFGYIGEYELLNTNNTLHIGIFDKDLFDGDIEFENPQINLNIQNSFGVPVEATINRFTGFNVGGDSLLLTLDDTINPYLFDFPTLAEYGQSKESVWSINITNSSVADFISLLPSSINYNISAISNPDTTNSPYNYVSDASKIDVGVEIILPLWFKTNSLALVDTMPMDLSNIGEQSEMIKQVNIILEISNGLPLDIDFQLYFTDSLNNYIDTLYSPAQQPIILGGQLDADFIVQTPGMKTTLVQFTGDDIDNFKNVRNAIFSAGLRTSEYDSDVSVKILDYYKVDFKMSVDVDYKINSNDL